jgi:two-component system, NarL family, invasion response regulator UvrY
MNNHNLHSDALSSEELGTDRLQHPITVMIVDDEAIIRTGLKKILAEYSNIEVIAEASSGEEAENKTDGQPPHVILMDISMPGQGGIETTRRILFKNPGVKILALSVHCDEHYPSQILIAGAHGYITKGVGAEEMIDAINSVSQGEQYICHAVSQKIKTKQLLGRDRLFDCLDSVELVICSDLVLGESVGEISRRQNLTELEVSTLRQQIFDKLSINNEVALVHLAIRNGLLDKDSQYFS